MKLKKTTLEGLRIGLIEIGLTGMFGERKPGLTFLLHKSLIMSYRCHQGALWVFSEPQGPKLTLMVPSEWALWPCSLA